MSLFLARLHTSAKWVVLNKKGEINDLTPDRPVLLFEDLAQTRIKYEFRFRPHPADRCLHGHLQF